jgi:hypothetical protein
MYEARIWLVAQFLWLMIGTAVAVAADNNGSADRPSCHPKFTFPAKVLAEDSPTIVFGISQLAIDKDAIYWTSNSDDTVKAVSLSGGVVRTLAKAQKLPAGIATYDKEVFWTSEAAGKVMRAPDKGGPLVEIASTQQRPYGITANADGVFWTTYGGHVMFLPKAANSPVVLSNGAPAWGIVAHGDQVLWAQGSYGPRGNALCDGSVYRLVAPYKPESKTEIASGQCAPLSIAVNDSAVFWTNYGGDAVMRQDIPHGQPSLVAKAEIPAYVAADNMNVYWTSSTAVLRAPISGGPVTTMIELVPDSGAPIRCQPGPIALNSTSLYFALDFKIMRMSR